MKINKQPQSLTVILKEAVEVISPQAKQKQITIVEQLTADLLSDDGRPGHALSGGAEPAEQRGQVHARRRHDHGCRQRVTKPSSTVITRIS